MANAPGRDVARDVRVRRDDRLGADAAAGVDHRTETDLRTILQHDRGEAVLEALEQGMADVVRDDQRAHRQEHLAADQHRPADVDERLVPDEGEIADREHRPRVAMTAASEPDRPARPDSRTEERAPAEQAPDPAPNWLDSPIATTSSQRIVARGPISTPSSMTICGAAISEPSPRTTPSPIWAPYCRRIAIFSSGGRRRNEFESERRRSKKRGIECARALVQIERGRQAHVLGREPGERRPAPWRGSGLLAGDQLLDVLLGDEAALLDRGQVDAVALRELGRLARRLALGGRGLGRRLLPLGVLRRATRAPRRSPRYARPSFRARPRRPPRRAARSSRRQAPRSRPSPSWSRRRIPAAPAVTSARSSTSHSARSANSVFASSRVRTISSIGG